MSKGILSFALAVSLSTFTSIPVFAISNDEAKVKQTERVKAGINKLGVGKDALLRIRLKNKKQLAGYISQAGSDSFVITDPGSGETKSVAYAEVTQVKGHNLTTKAKAAIWVGVAVGITLFLWWIKTQVDDCC